MSSPEHRCRLLNSAFALAAVLPWLWSCSPVSPRGSTQLPGEGLSNDVVSIVKIRMRDHVVTVLADGPVGPGFVVYSEDGTRLSGLLTAAEFEDEFPAVSQRYQALLADDAGPLIDAAYPPGGIPEPTAPEPIEQVR